MKFIGFGKLSYYLIFPLFTPVFSSLFVTLSKSFISKDSKENTLYDHPLIACFFMFISQILVGLLELISNKLQKHKKDKSIDLAKYQTVYFLEAIQVKKKPLIDTKFYLIMFGLVIIETVAFTITCCLLEKDKEVDYIILISQVISLQMVFSGLFSYPILHYKIFRHQFVALGLFILGIVFISAKTISEIKNQLYALAFVCALPMWSFQSVIAKWLMDTKLMSQFKYLFIHGAMGAILIGIILTFSMYIPCNAIFCYKGVEPPVLEDTWNSLGWMFSSEFILNMFCLFIITSVYNTFQVTTINLFTPTHNDASEALGSLISWIYMAYIEKYKDKFNLSCQIIGFILIIVASLMYNEIIIIYMCNFNYYTRIEISKRSEDEINSSNIDVSLIDLDADINTDT